MNEKTDKPDKPTRTTPPSILRLSGSYRSTQLTNHPSITITLPTDTASGGAEQSNDASDAQERRQRREQFEQLRRDHYHNMYSSISGLRHSAASSGPRISPEQVSNERRASTEPEKKENAMKWQSFWAREGTFKMKCNFNKSFKKLTAFKYYVSKISCSIEPIQTWTLFEAWSKLFFFICFYYVCGKELLRSLRKFWIFQI